MCVAFWSLTHPEYALVLCANRDEFLDRPTLPAHFHSFEALSQPVSVSNAAVQPDKGTSSVLSGRDMLAGGAWLGIHRPTGRVALLTNITEPWSVYASSRGTLVASFLGDPCGDLTSEATALTRRTTPYAGFNMLLLEPVPSTSAAASTLAYDARLVTNDGAGGPIRSRPLTDAERACGGLSNGQWPKVVQGRGELDKVLGELSRGPETETDERLARRLIELLTTRGAEKYNLVPPFDMRVAKPDAPHAYYGTRLAQVVLIRRNGHITYFEHDVWLLDTTGAPMRAGANNMRTFTFHMGSDS
ncbi:NRDE protein-domain-containing protein [Lactarius quietus]|nr:NRDE protein-domain-containing protein [Lactarius quietus]